MAGNKNSGRKGAGWELANRELLWQWFTGELSKDDLEKAVASGKFSLRDRMLLNAMNSERNNDISIAILKKLFPDKLELGGDHANPVRIVEIKKRDLPKA